MANYIDTAYKAIDKTATKILPGIYKAVYNFIDKTIVGNLAGYGVAKQKVLLLLFAIPYILIFIFSPVEFFKLSYGFLIVLPFVLPFAFAKQVNGLRKGYNRLRFIKSQKPVLLEVILPKEMKKGPKAMEMFFSGIHVAPGESVKTKVHFEGSTRPWWSFEFVSIEGEIHIYIWTFSKQRHLVETQMKANFPDIELIEVDDYLDGFVPDLDKVDIWGTDYKFTKDDVYPIKGYVDWGLDKVETLKDVNSLVDPIDTVFEKLAGFGEGEVAILHIMFQVTKNDNWKKDVEKEIDKIYKKRTESFPSFSDPNSEVEGFAQLRPQEWALVNTLKFSTEKDAFDVGIRMVYIARKDKFDPGNKVGANIVHLYRAFEAPNLNYPIGIAHWLAGFDYPWQDPKGKIQKGLKKKIIDALRKRSYFNPPYAFDNIVLTTEELATICHFPIGSKRFLTKSQNAKNKPPANLPV